MPCSSPQVARDLLYMASGTDNKGHGPLPRGLLATWNLSHMRDEYPDVLGAGFEPTAVKDLLIIRGTPYRLATGGRPQLNGD